MADLRADLLLVTVTDVETRAVLKAFQDETGLKAVTSSVGEKVYHDLGELHGTRVALVRSEPGAVVIGGALQTVQQGIDALSPSAVIMVGIAFGVNEGKQAIGDVLVSKQLVAYEPQRAGGKGRKPQIVPRGGRVDCSHWLLDRCRNARLNWDESDVHVGLVLSGEKLVDHLDFRQQLVAMEPEAIGGEMEGAGLYAACQSKRVDWILIKAICDWADGEKATDKRNRQALAARNAAGFVVKLLELGPLTRATHRTEPTTPRFERTGLGVAGPLTAGRDVITTTYIGASPETPRPYSSIPNQPFFFGRDAEREIVADAIAPESRTWGVLIDGPGGIGKTALAIRAAHDAPEADFDRKVFLSAKVRELTPAGETPLEDFMLPNYLALLTELARELGEADIARTPENERANAVRRALTKQRVLIVVDNLETFPETERTRLFQFLSRLPPGCKAIVTSRRRTDVDARIVRLDRLELKDALDLLDALADNNPLLAAADEDERRRLYEATGGNPLLLRWTAGQLGRRESRCRTVADALNFLSAAPPGNDPLEYVFGDLLDTFTENEEAVLAALTHFTLPAKAAWIANLAGISELQAQTALEDLTGRALVTSDATSETFVLPPLTAGYLRQRRPETVARTGDRLMDRAYALALENGFQRHDRFPVLDAEWPLVAAALPRFVDAGRAGASARLQFLCSALGDFLDFSGHWDEWLQLSEQAEKIAIAVGDFSSAGWHAYFAGWVYHMRGQADELRACADRAEIHWRENGDARERAFAIRLQGIGHETAGDDQAALRAYQQALKLYVSLESESADVIMVLNDIAAIQGRSGNLDAAESTYHQTLRIAKKNGHREEVATLTGNLATIALGRKEWPEAERQAREALRLAEQVRRQELIGQDCLILAEALHRQGRGAEGLPYAQRAVDVFATLRSPDLGEAREMLRACEEGSAET